MHACACSNTMKVLSVFRIDTSLSSKQNSIHIGCLLSVSRRVAPFNDRRLRSLQRCGVKEKIRSRKRKVYK